jgi:hypothetical protein
VERYFVNRSIQSYFFQSRIFQLVRTVAAGGPVAHVAVIWQSNATAPPPLADWYQLTGLSRRVGLEILQPAAANLSSRFQVSCLCQGWKNRV